MCEDQDVKDVDTIRRELLREEVKEKTEIESQSDRGFSTEHVERQHGDGDLKEYHKKTKGDRSTYPRKKRRVVDLQAGAVRILLLANEGALLV